MMRYSNKPFLFLLSCSFLLIFQLVNAESEPLQFLCPNTETYNTSNSQYATNLDTLFKSLIAKVPQTGFGTKSIGKGENRVYGLAMCRIGASVATCKSCVTEASSSTGILRICRGLKEVVIWYDDCSLKFSNQDFIGSVDYEDRFYQIIPNVAKNPELVAKKSTDLLTGLVRKASRSSKLYATGTVGVKGEANNTMYGSAQCTRDLNAPKCKLCLDQALAELPVCCTDRVGGRVVSASCNIRFDLYPFFNT